jgi:(2R)-3-sulfolactate dehydrogenase (NADP+)
MPRLTLDAVETLAFDSLSKRGAAAGPARSVARSIRQAEADDIPLVGLGYLPVYLSHLASGKVDGKAVPTVRQSAPAVVHCDAANGFAHPAFDEALPLLEQAARACGTASLAVARSYSAGVLGHWVEALAERGLVAFAATNAPPSVAPWGGATPLFGTNPIAFATPREGRPPLVFDQATSVVAKVSIVAAAREGRPLPPGWALDAEGQPTTDPEAALKGSMLPFGGVKGGALNLMVDLLAAGLTGANFSKDVPYYARTDGPPAGVGQFVIAFDPGAFDEDYLSRIEGLFAAMLAQDGVRLPGDRRLAARERTAREGVFVDETLLARIEEGKTGR